MMNQTHRSRTGKKLYAVRDPKGRFKDIQTYQRAHKANLRRTAKRRLYDTFKPYIVKRQGGNCGLWIGIAELDSLVREILKVVGQHVQS